MSTLDGVKLSSYICIDPGHALIVDAADEDAPLIGLEFCNEANKLSEEQKLAFLCMVEQALSVTLKKVREEGTSMSKPKCGFCGEVTPTCPNPTCVRCLNLDVMQIATCAMKLLDDWDLALGIAKAVARLARVLCDKSKDLYS